MNMTTLTGTHDGDDSVTWRAIVGALLAAIVILGGVVWNSTAAQIRDLTLQSQNRGERIVALERDDTNLKETLQQVQLDLRQMNNKLDELLQRGR